MWEQCKHTVADTPVGAFVNSTFGQVHAGAFVTPTIGVGMCPGAFVTRIFRAGRHSGAFVRAPSRFPARANIFTCFDPSQDVFATPSP